MVAGDNNDVVVVVVVVVGGGGGFDRRGVDGDDIISIIEV